MKMLKSFDPNNSTSEKGLGIETVIAALFIIMTHTQKKENNLNMHVFQKAHGKWH